MGSGHFHVLEKFKVFIYGYNYGLQTLLCLNNFQCSRIPLGSRTLLDSRKFSRVSSVYIGHGNFYDLQNFEGFLMFVYNILGLDTSVP